MINHMKCRPGCAACCTVISISSPLPGMPDGKSASMKCINLSNDNLCTIYHESYYPDVCRKFSPSPEICGTDREQAIQNLTRLEKMTTP